MQKFLSSMKAWLKAFRLRTLPLALTSIGMGAILATMYQKFSPSVLILSIITTIFLQILSNIANDYGDSVSGVDSAEREGPTRTVQTGEISKSAMKKAIFIFITLSLVSGISLLYMAFFYNPTENSWKYFFSFFGIGLLAIVAAITYTVGKRPYGYVGLGDLSVLLFFGLVGVIGSFFLHTHTFEWDLLLPATSCGLFSVAVLNVNNIRDIESDRKAGKNSIPVRLGREKAVLYHYTILVLAILLTLVYAINHFEIWYQYAFLLTTPLLIRNAWAVRKLKGLALDPFLKQMALTALLYVITFGLGIWLRS